MIGDGPDAAWNKVGAAWENKDDKGMNLVFDVYPVTGHISVRVASEKRGGDDQSSLDLAGEPSNDEPQDQ